jgi:hypothetical protein
MRKLGVTLLLIVISIVPITLNLQYNSPNAMVFFIIPPMLDQVAAYYQVRTFDMIRNK